MTIPSGWSMFTPTFEGFEGGEMSLGDITVCNADGVEFDDANNGAGRSRRKVTIYKLKDNVCEVSASYGYTSAGYVDKPTTWGWGSNKDVKFSAGEGVIVYNNQGSEVKFLVSGDVTLEPVVSIPIGWGIFGNNTPVDITLGDITVCNEAGVEFDDDTNGAGRSRRKVTVYKLKDTLCEVSSSYGYTSAGYAANPKPATWGWGSSSSVVLKAGEALIVYNNQGTSVQFKLKKPVED